MSVVTTLKYRNHTAEQFVESLTEGLQTFGANTVTANANSTVLTVSGNVFSSIRSGDILIVNSLPDEARAITNVSANGTQLTINAAMSVVLTAQSFKTRNAIAAYDSYYLFVGRSTPWPNGDSANNITSPIDSENSQYDYLDDVLTLRRITSDDLVFVVPKYDWSANSKYAMYDHRSNISAVLANTEFPFYVRTSGNEVFKCLYNGRVNALSGAANSTSEPTITGVSSPSDLITTSAETSSGADDSYYVWKYLYSISSEDANKFVTGNYMPVRSPIDTIDAVTGDVENTSTASYLTFNDARSTGNGAIYRIVVDAPGSGYDAASPPTVVIDGDGSGAIAAVDIAGGVIRDIHMVAYGENYSFATVLIGNGSSATATAIISPRNSFVNTSGRFYVSNHGIDNKDELYSKHVMLYVEFEGTANGYITTANEYRRIGILKNPVLSSGQVAAANLYDMTTTLTITTGDNFNKDEIVWQSSTGAYGVVVEQTAGTLKLVHVSRTAFSNTVADTTIIGVGNGNTDAVLAATGDIVPSSLPESFDDIVAPSSATATVSAVASPTIVPRTGEILYLNHISPVYRSNTQTEAIRTVLTF